MGNAQKAFLYVLHITQRSVLQMFSNWRCALHYTFPSFVWGNSAGESHATCKPINMGFLSFGLATWLLQDCNQDAGATQKTVTPQLTHFTAKTTSSVTEHDCCQKTAFDLGKGWDIFPQAPLTIPVPITKHCPQRHLHVWRIPWKLGSCHACVCFTFPALSVPTYRPGSLSWRGRETW